MVRDMSFLRASSVSHAKEIFFREGCVLIPAALANLRTNMLSDLESVAMAWKPKWMNLRGDGRWSLNSQEHVMTRAWHNALRSCMEDDSAVAGALRAIAEDQDPHYKRFALDVMGGDIVQPGGIGQEWHSDDYQWSCGFERPGTVAISMFVHDVSELQAPMKVCPLSLLNEVPQWLQEDEHREKQLFLSQFDDCRIIGQKGDVFIRDVCLWHAGTANETDVARCLPGFRIMTLARIGRTDYRPSRWLADSWYTAMMGSEGTMARFCEYLWCADHDNRFLGRKGEMSLCLPFTWIGNNFAQYFDDADHRDLCLVSQMLMQSIRLVRD